ncbi:MAG: DNA mismatch repair endonuclease MutL [Bacteroidota bacterium]|nr:DNA mismatch repair endonuclease MutL [Bacteroidota bacterium]
MNSIIQLLPDHVANQIAAGEVVQRPASVVKELLENAIDAKSTDIKLIVKDGGKSLIQVIDNGIGMSITDARLCFERHATSKIRIAEDLFNLSTKGFRGEALASIAAIAQVDMVTKQADDELGTQIIIEGSKVLSQDKIVCAKGTSFSVKNLFFNIPARRNFLKSDAVEMRHIIDEFHRVALAHPDISFSLYSNGNELFKLPVSNLRQRIVNIFGGKTNEKLVPITEETEIVTIKGFVGKPEYSKKNKGEQFFFVNDRFIKNGYLHHAVMNAYEGLLKEGLQPAYFIYLYVPKDSLDINIHPTKTEVKFEDEQLLYAILRATIKHSLGQFNIMPVLDFDKDPSLEVPYDYFQKEIEDPLIQVDASYNPFTITNSEKQSDTIPTFKSKINRDASWQALYVDVAKEKTNPLPTFSIEEDQTIEPLFDKEYHDVGQDSVLTYQIQKKYIVNPIKSGLLIINQQRAHQRILYENILTKMTTRQTGTQKLLFPIELIYSQNETAILKEIQSTLEYIGFEFEQITNDDVVINGLPVEIKPEQVSYILETLIYDYKEGFANDFSRNDTIARSLSNSMSVKNGQILNQDEQLNIVNQLFACKEPDLSPFSKKVFITITADELERKF